MTVNNFLQEAVVSISRPISQHGITAMYIHYLSHLSGPWALKVLRVINNLGRKGLRHFSVVVSLLALLHSIALLK